jgi:hypothetical protein
MDSPKCQTPTVSPAEAGDFPFLVKRHDQETEQLKAKTPRGRLPAIPEQGEAWLRPLIHQESDFT